jgi:hypothetical protein
MPTSPEEVDRLMKAGIGEILVDCHECGLSTADMILYLHIHISMLEEGGYDPVLTRKTTH